MTSLAQSTASWTSRFHTDYVMHLTRVGRFVFFTVLWNVEHIGAIWQFMEVFLRFRCLKLKRYYNKNPDYCTFSCEWVKQKMMMYLIENMLRGQTKDLYDFIHLVHFVGP